MACCVETKEGNFECTSMETEWVSMVSSPMIFLRASPHKLLRATGEGEEEDKEQVEGEEEVDGEEEHENGTAFVARKGDGEEEEREGEQEALKTGL